MDSTHDRAGDAPEMQDRDPDEAWLTDAVRATTLGELKAVARAARAAGDLTPRDQAWCRVLAAHLSDVDAAAMRVAVAQLGAVTT